MRPTWYLRRLSRMGPREVAARAVVAARVHRWRRVLDDAGSMNAVWLPNRRFIPVLPDQALDAVTPAAKACLLSTADELMAGRAEYFGIVRDDMVAPDWSRDPKSGRSAPTDRYAFDIPYRDEHAVGDIKQLWEPSRHQHLTVLAAAYALTGDEQYADRVAEHLRSWWADNPPLRGVHWVSGIELGIRLISWVWVRRLLDRWSGAAALFEDNPEALHQIWHHQRWLAALGSHGSSANNHVIAETAGQLVAACAFDWFPESPSWRSAALRQFDEQLHRNTFASGLNRELATEYHGLVLELGLAAAVEADAAGVRVPDTTWLVLMRMCDTLAAIVDVRLNPPRQGDADEGYGLIVDGMGVHRWASLLHTGDQLFGGQSWWPAVPADDVRTPLVAALTNGARNDAVRPSSRPDHLADAGMTIRARPTSTARSGAVVTAARTGSCRSPRTRTPTHCRSRCGTMASTSSPTPAPTATTGNPNGAPTSGPPSGTTRSSWTAGTSRSPAARSCGPATPARACSLPTRAGAGR